MMHFEINTSTNKDILYNFSISSKSPDYYKSSNISCQHYLSQGKMEIEKNSKAWDMFKKITNPYEYIHTTLHNNKISKYRPLSRAFYKMIEMIHFFSLMDINTEHIMTFHLAEGPGGFIEAVDYYRKHNCHRDIYNNDSYYGMTLVNDNDIKIPGWGKSTHFLKRAPNVKLEYGPSGNGDLCDVSNLDFVYSTHKNSCMLVTGDGGFDFSLDFNKQESLAMKLILSELFYGLIITKKGGHFVTKIFDMFTRCSYEIIYILKCLFNEVYICKPETSRYGNSEKYIVCKGKIKDITDSEYSIIRESFIHVMDYNDDFSNLSILNIGLPMHIKNTIQEINCVFTERQLDNIHNTLTLINNTKRNSIINEYNIKHVDMSIEWCKKHNIEYNTYNEQNMFT